MPELRITTGHGETFTYALLQDLITIGRSQDNDIVLNDHTASRQHVRLRRTPDGYLITDLESHNGTYINGSRIKSHVLRTNDLAKIGTSTLIFLDLKEDSVDQHPREEKSHYLNDIVPLQTQLIQNLSISEDSDLKVLASIKSHGIMDDAALLTRVEPKERETSRISVLDLEKSNKILYVLYQISRKLNTVADFDELLSAIMDSIFQIINADYGFVALVDDGSDELIPKVVKYRTAPENQAQELRFSRTIIDKVIHEKVSVLSSNAMDDTRFGGAKSIFMQNIRSVISVPLWRKDDVIGVIQVDSFRLSNKFTRADLSLLTTISNQMAMVIEQATLNDRLRREAIMRSRLERFHSPEIVDLIISGENEDEETILAPKEKMVTILFTDIINFTRLAEMLSPTEVSQLLNQYFKEMTDIIFDYNGTLDKYMGDAIMAVFGAPIERENDAERAVLTALEIRNSLRRLMEKTEPHKRFDIRTGINTGQVLAGNLGSPKRMDYSVIGDVVNTASRLESIAKPNQILIGESTYQCVNSKAITVYEVLD
jgi:adenylate cyclase